MQRFEALSVLKNVEIWRMMIYIAKWIYNVDILQNDLKGVEISLAFDFKNVDILPNVLRGVQTVCRVCFKKWTDSSNVIQGVRSLT